MSEDANTQKIYDHADRFIELANALAKADDSGAVGAALRYAAARYSAFEAAFSNPNLAEEKEKEIRYIGESFRLLLDENLEFYIRQQDGNNS